MTPTPAHLHRRSTRVPSTAVLLLLLAASAGVALLLGSRARDLGRGLPAPSAPGLAVDGWVEVAVTTTGAVAAAWLSLSAALALVCALARAAGRTWSVGERVVRAAAPSIVRRALAAAVGAGLGLGGVAAAGAAPSPADLPVHGDRTAVSAAPVASLGQQTGDASGPRTSSSGSSGEASGVAPRGGAPSVGDAPGDVVELAATADLGWQVPQPTDVAPAGTEQGRQTDTPAAPTVEPAGTAAPSATTEAPSATTDVSAPAPRTGRAGQAAGPDLDPRGSATEDDGRATVTVRRGDTLWALARRAIGPDATAAEIGDAWPRWYEANRSTIGADPDLLLPGQVLVVPQDAR